MFVSNYNVSLGVLSRTSITHILLALVYSKVMNAFQVTENSKPLNPGKNWNFNFTIIEGFIEGLVGFYNMYSSVCVPAFQKIDKFGLG
jgi:hypothetical protein